MRITDKHLAGSVLPTVVVVAVVMLIAMLGLLSLWEHETLLFARSCRLRQARADVESAYMLYRLHPEYSALTAEEGYRLFDSLPGSWVRAVVQPWGLYDAVRVCTSDSLLHVCRLFGAAAEPSHTLYYADSRNAVTLAGHTILKGMLSLPQNGVAYGRMGSDHFDGEEILHTHIRQSEEAILSPDKAVAARIAALFAAAQSVPLTSLPDSVFHSFLQDSALQFRLADAEIAGCSLRGRIVLCADELRIDSTCRIENLLICARKVTIGAGAHITAQLFVRDTAIVEPRAVLGYPSGIYARQYVRIGNRAEIDGYVIVCDTVRREKLSANYVQSKTARLRGLLYVDGVAQAEGIVSGSAVLDQAVYFSPEGYYQHMLYNFTLLENRATTQPLWLPSKQRKEALCAE